MIVTYEAIDAQGHKSHDSVEADTPREAVELLRSRGLFVTKAEESTSSKKAARQPAGNIGEPHLPLKTLSLVTRQIAMLLRAGSGVVPALAAIRRQLSKPRQQALLDKLVLDLEDGVPLTDALRQFPRTFDTVFCAIVAAGEASGTLPEMFERLGGIVGKRRAMVKKVLGALAYPVLLIGMCSSIMSVLLFFVLPRFEEMFRGLNVEVPASTQFLLSFGAAARNHWMILGGALGIIVGAFVWALTSPVGRQFLTDVQLSIPLFGRLRSRLIQGQIFRTMGTLLESNVGLLETLDLARSTTANRKYQALFNRMEDAITSGGSLSAAFQDSPLVESYICHAIHTGEESGGLGGSLSYVADTLDETNTELVNAVARLIEPLILIGMGIVVGGVAISLFLPLFDLTAAIN